MSEQTSHQLQTKAIDARLVDLYKPVGIAALNAAALCQKPYAVPKQNK
jgi:hypothetical protein